MGSAGATKVVDTTNIAPGHGAFTDFGLNPSIDGSKLVFGGSYSGGSGIYAGNVGTAGAVKVVDTSDTVPGHGTFTSFLNASVSGNKVVFGGLYGGGSGIYTADLGSSSVTKVVDTTDIAPGHGVFTDFSGFVTVSGDEIGFIGSYSSGSTIYLEFGGILTPVLSTGDALFGGTVTSFGLHTFGLDGNELAFNYSLANGVGGVAVATFRAVPEPSSFTLLVIAATACVCGWSFNRRGAKGGGGASWLRRTKPVAG